MRLAFISPPQYTYTCSSTSSASGSLLNWSALYAKIAFSSVPLLNLFDVNVNAGANNLWYNIANTPYPLGLAGPAGLVAGVCGFSSTFYSTTNSSPR